MVELQIPEPSVWYPQPPGGVSEGDPEKLRNRHEEEVAKAILLT